MIRTQGLISQQNCCFADAYEVYVDYGKGQPIKMKKNEATFLDVEKFLVGYGDHTKMVGHKKPITSNSGRSSWNFVRRSSCSHDGQENTDPQSLYNRRASFTPRRSHRRLSTSSASTTIPTPRIESKIIYDETWLSTKPYNPRITAFLDYIHEQFDEKTKKIAPERQSFRGNITCQAPTRPRVPEICYPTINEAKLCLSIAVNGMSKSMRGQIPLSNLNINSGDYGDDAAMFVDNRAFSFVGLADGAGGNRSLGLNPADFSQAVLSTCRTFLQRNHFHTKQLPRLVLSVMEQVEARKVRGSSTLCLLALDKEEHTLTSLNIGDSGFVIYRNNEIYHRAKTTMNPHGRGPRQVFSLDDTLGVPCFINENEILRDCSLETIRVQKGDLVILSSDGLWDVVEADQVQQIIKRNANNCLQSVADDLLNEALKGYVAEGRDDILIIVCRVNEL